VFLTDPLVVRKILEQLGLETAPLPLAPARVGERGLRLWTWDGSEIAAEAGARSQSVEPEVGIRERACTQRPPPLSAFRSRPLWDDDLYTR
jgi:hypothetical protein